VPWHTTTAYTTNAYAASACAVRRRRTGVGVRVEEAGVQQLLEVADDPHVHQLAHVIGLGVGGWLIGCVWLGCDAVG